MGRGFIQKINDTAIYAEKIYSPNFSKENKVFVLSLHYNSENSYLFVNVKEVIKFKAKDSETKARPIVLGSISTNDYLSSNDIKDSKLYGNVYDFSVDYSSTTNDKTQGRHKYLIEKYNIV